MTDRVVVITGASSGIGAALAQTLAVDGASLVLVARRQAELEAVAARCGGRTIALATDVTSRDAVRRVVQEALSRFGRIDVWVNNAGATSTYGPVLAIQPEAFTRVVQTNVLGTYHGSIVALRHLLSRLAGGSSDPKGGRGQGKLINVLGRGDRQHTPFLVAYGASKTWVRSFTLALAQEHKDSGVGIYAINPGLMRTDLMTHIETIEGYERRLQPLATVLRLLGQPPEVPAEKVVWLASAATDGRTGLEVRAQGRLEILRHAAREGLQWLLGRGAPVTLHVTTVPPADSRADPPGATGVQAQG